MDRFQEELTGLVGADRIKLKEPMKLHTTFRAGGPAAYFAEPDGEESLRAVIALCRQQEIPYFVLGNGSNLLVGDRGYQGLMIRIGKAWSEISAEGTKIRAGAGALLSAVAKQALCHSLTGLEFAAGIPGTVGGAIVMNAGAYGSEMKNVLKRVRVMDESGAVLELDHTELRLGYRSSCIPERGYIVLEAEFELTFGTETAIREQMEDLAGRRRQKQPLEYPSAGSTFKRPEGYFAGKLIEDAGLKGCRLGGAQVSEKHCGFVVNREDATAADILELCQEIRRKVKEQFGVELELEVRLLGDF